MGHVARQERLVLGHLRSGCHLFLVLCDTCPNKHRQGVCVHGCRHPTSLPELLESPSMGRLIEASKSPIRRGLSMSMPKLAHSSSALLRTSSKNKSRLWTGLSGSDINAVLPDKGEHLRPPCTAAF